MTEGRRDKLDRHWAKRSIDSVCAHVVKIGADVSDDSIWNGQNMTEDSPFQLDQTRLALAAIVRSWSWPRICPLARSLAHHPPPGLVVPPFCDRSHSGTNEGEQAVGWSVRPSDVHVATSSVQSCDRLHESRPSLPRHSAKSMSQSPFLLFLSSSRPRPRVRPSRPPVDSDDPPSFSTGVQSPPLSPSCLRSPYLALPASHPPSFLPLNSLGRLIW